MTGFPHDVVTAAWARAEGCCERCSAPLRWDARGVDWSAQHRAARGMGGTREPSVSTVANCAILCGSGTTGCHGIVENRDRGQGYADGWALRTGSDPATTPVRHWQHGYVLLTADGRYEAAS